MTTLSAIPIRELFIDMILAGAKIWEIRSKFTKKIGPVALIRSGPELSSPRLPWQKLLS